MDEVSDDVRSLCEAIHDLTGQPSPSGRGVPEAAVALLRAGAGGLGYSQFNELLLHLGYARVTHAFFQFLVDRTTEYKSGATLRTISHVRKAVDEFRKVALLFFGSIKYAFASLSSDASFLKEHLSRFDKRKEKNFRDRHARIFPPEVIDGNDTYYLGYVIKAEIARKLETNPADRDAQEAERKRQGIVYI